MHVAGWRRPASVLLLVFSAVSASPKAATRVPPAAPPAQPPLPEVSSFLAEVRRHIRLDALGQAEYTCVQRETEVRLDGDGKPVETNTRLFEIYPPAPGTGPYRRLVARNNVPVPASELAENDRKRKAEVEERQRQFQHESPTDRDRRIRREADERREREALVDEAFRNLQTRVIGREWLGGRPAIVLGFEPRPGASASTRIGAIIMKLSGRLWVDEQDFEIVKVDARAIDDVTYGFGMFARIYKGTTVLWERQKVNGEAWMPVRLEIRATARLLLFRRLGLHRIIDYFDYRKPVSASAAFAGGR